MKQPLWLQTSRVSWTHIFCPICVFLSSVWLIKQPLVWTSCSSNVSMKCETERPLNCRYLHSHTFLYIFLTLSVFRLRKCCAQMTPKENSKEHFKMETIFLIPIHKVTFLSLGCNIARLAWKQAHSIWLTQTPLFHRPIFLYPTECTQSRLNIFTAEKHFERGCTN